MSLYLDTSVFLKLFLAEPESGRVAKLITEAPQFVVSSLTRLEALIQIDALVAGGLMSRSHAGDRRTRVERLLNEPTCRFERCPVTMFDLAELQLHTAYCRTVDRLHLATMEALHLRRLFTNDDRQADAARALGWEVILPR